MEINVDSCIAKLLEVRGQRPGKAVNLTEHGANAPLNLRRFFPR